MRVIDVAAQPFAVRPGLSLAVHGGLGDPGHSVIGLYAPTLRRFGATLVAVDPEAGSAARRAAVAERLGLAYTQCRTPAEHLDRVAAGERPDAALILTPVATHLGILEQYAAAPRPPRQVVVEKPAVGLAGMDALAAVVARLGADRCCFIDTAMVAPSIGHAVRVGALAAIGRVRRIVALGLDNPWEAPGRAQFALAARQAALNARGVLVPGANGGAGAGFDMGIHAVTGLSVVLAHLGLSLSDLRTGSVRLELADLPGWRREPGGETHLLVSGGINDVAVLVEAGKGADTWDRRVELYGERGVCVLGFGTLAHRPGLWLRTDGGETLWRFPDRDTGYARHLRDLAVLLGASPGTPTLTPADSSRHMLAALRLMAAWYRRAGATPADREPIGRVPGHDNPLLDDEQRAVRQRLDALNRGALSLLAD